MAETHSHWAQQSARSLHSLLGRRVVAEKMWRGESFFFNAQYVDKKKLPYMRRRSDIEYGYFLYSTAHDTV